MFDRLRALCVADTENLAELASIAAPGDCAFFDGAEFFGADLRGTDFTGFQMLGATFVGASMDDKTILPATTILSKIFDDQSLSIEITNAIDAISTMIKTQVFNAVESLESRTIKMDGARISGPIRRKLTTIPRTKQRTTRMISNTYKIRSAAAEISAFKKLDVTIESLDYIIGLLSVVARYCDNAVNEYDQRADQNYKKYLQSILNNISPSVNWVRNEVVLDREQWKKVLAELQKPYGGGVTGSKASAGEILVRSHIRLIVLIGRLRDIRRGLPGHQEVDEEVRLFGRDRDEALQEFIDQGSVGRPLIM